MTNAERIRQMSDEELLETIYRLQENAVSCPVCLRNKGRERLKIWLSLPVSEKKQNEKTTEESVSDLC